MKDTAIIHIDYDEGNQASYRAVEINGERFASGDPVADFLEALEYASAFFLVILKSSDVDSFVMDGKWYGLVEHPLWGEILIKL